MIFILYFAIALVMGIFAPVQGTINAQLGKHLHHPLQATMVNFLGGFVSLAVMLLVIRPPIPDLIMLKGTSWYHYTGGIIGVLFVTGMIVLIPKIGAANLLATAIAGQLIMSLFIDHYGWLDTPVRQISINRIIGVLLLIIGVYLIQKK